MLRNLFKYPWLPFWVRVRNEKDTHPHVKEERAELFDAMNGASTELEVLNWLNATVRMLKPSKVLETGSANGLGTVALSRACKSNGFGKVHSIELELGTAVSLRRKTKILGLQNYVEVHNMNSLQFLKETSHQFEIGFFDSDCEIRAEEFEICLQRKLITKLAVFHDTSPYRCRSTNVPNAIAHERYRSKLLELVNGNSCTGYFESSLSRGLFCIFFQTDN